MIETQRDQLNELAIKIAELKEENERLNGELAICDSLLKINVSRIDKAIEYIEVPDNLNNAYDRVSKETINELLEILKGENNE